MDERWKSCTNGYLKIYDFRPGWNLTVDHPRHSFWMWNEEYNLSPKIMYCETSDLTKLLAEAVRYATDIKIKTIKSLLIDAIRWDLTCGDCTSTKFTNHLNQLLAILDEEV